MHDIVVIGAGVAGMTSALYALRNGKTVLVVEGESVGGQIALSPKVENFPTHKQISGEELSSQLFDQITCLGADFEFDSILSIEKVDNIFKIKGEFSNYEAKAVIIANGVKHRHLKIENEKNLIGKGVYYCALCDGPFYKGKEVTIIGDGNTALQYTLLLSDICKKVNLVIMFDRFFGDEWLVDLVKKRENVEITTNSKTVDLVGKEELEKIVFERNDGTRFEINNTPLFVAIGQIPDNKRFENLAELDKEGYFVANESTETKTPGLFVAGDCRTKSVRQLTTASCDGAVAATKACEYINKIGM